MLEWSQLGIFVTASLALLLTPGPAVMYIIARSVDQGRRAGLVSVLGIEIGGLFHVAAAALGLSWVLRESALAYEMVKYLGAAYLIYLGIRTLMSAKNVVTEVEVRQERSLRRAFRQGIVVNILNPKTALFFFAFLPQFVNTAKGQVELQTLFWGMLFVMMATCTDGMYALAAGTMGGWLKGNLRFLRGQRYFAGTVYIGLGITTALASPSKK